MAYIADIYFNFNLYRHLKQTPTIIGIITRPHVTKSSPSVDDEIKSIFLPHKYGKKN